MEKMLVSFCYFKSSQRVDLLGESESTTISLFYHILFYITTLFKEILEFYYFY
jgi:hypothetical protein